MKGKRFSGEAVIFNDLKNSVNPLMKVEHIREQLHLLIEEVDDIYVLNGLYRNLLADKRQREAYEQEQIRKTKKKEK